MNKNDLIAAMAEKAGLTKAQAKSALDAFTATTSEALKNGDKISITGFGAFEVKERAARKGRNPQTNTEIEIPAKSIVRFKAGSELKF